MIYTNDPLKLGASGRAVTFLQTRLGISMHGVFDAVTDDVLKRAQSAAKLAPDGIYGPATNAALTVAHPATLAAVAEGIAVEPKALQALVTIETVGRGFYGTGMPKLLLERHYVYRQATAAQRQQLPADVCNPAPGGYVGGLAEWARFDRVAAVDVNLAIESCSWGIAQIMGIQCQRFNLSPATFMLLQATDEDSQLMFLGRFVQANAALHDALRTKNWPEVARLYNGAGYAANHYDTKLAAAYAAIQ